MKGLKRKIIKNTLIIAGLLNLVVLNAQNLDEHQWKNRILIIQAPKELSSKYQDQLKEFSNSDLALKERKFVLYEIIGDKYRMTDFQNEKANESWKNFEELPKNIAFSKAVFRVLLIGLDGGIKLEKTEVLKKKELFQLIDSMPMRRKELNSQRKKRDNKTDRK